MAKHTVRALALAWSGLLLIATTPADAEPSAHDRVASELDCAKVVAEARNYAYGYNHVVTLSNQCQKAVSCEVWTNVDPTPHLTLAAKPGQSSSVVTRVGSPSRVVQAEKNCRFQ